MSRGWDGISFTFVATASATQRYKDIFPFHFSLPLLLLSRLFLWDDFGDNGTTAIDCLTFDLPKFTKSI